jgi:hypothetical protein
MTVPKRFGTLRFISGAMKVIAWIVLVLSILFAIFAGFSTATQFVPTLSGQNIPIIGGFLSVLGSSAGGFAAAIFSILLGVIYFVIFYALAEGISMQLAVEENTRLTAALLLRMHQESQPDTRATSAYTSYPSEPFEG